MAEQTEPRTNLNKFGQMCTSLDKFGQVWTNLDKFGLEQVLKNVFKFRKT